MTRHLTAAARAACIAAALTAGLAPATSQAQSMQSISDRVAQLQASLSAFATSTAARFDGVIAKLDAILASVAAPTTPRVLATSQLELSSGYYSTCDAVNVGTSPATVAFQLIDSEGLTLSSTSSSLAPGGTWGALWLATDARRVWCRIEPATAGAQLRASLTTKRFSDGVTIVLSEAR